MDLVLLTGAGEDAVCLDGSPPGYYWRPGHGTGARSWILFLEGGGWCAGVDAAVGGFDACAARARGNLGSSKGLGPSMVPGYEGGATLSADPSVNPRFWNWNVAYAHYCDGASFAGNRSDPVPTEGGGSIYFRGAPIFAAIVANITAPVSAGGKGMTPSTSKEALLSGCSAGGLAVYLHCDAFAGLLAPTPTKCVADAGYFANLPSAFGSPPAGHPNSANSIIEYEYSWVFTHQHVNNSAFGANQNCLEAMGSDNPLCFFPEVTLEFTETPLFVLQSGYDSWQTNFIWFTPDGGKPTDPGWHACAQTISACNASQLVLLAKYHGMFLGKLAPMTNTSTPHGGFVDSCGAHCQSGGVVGSYNGRTSIQTIAAW